MALGFILGGGGGGGGDNGQVPYYIVTTILLQRSINFVVALEKQNSPVF